MTDMNVGRVFQAVGSLARYRCIARDRDGCYIMRSMRSPSKCIVLTELALLAHWRVIA